MFISFNFFPFLIFHNFPLSQYPIKNTSVNKPFKPQLYQIKFNKDTKAIKVYFSGRFWLTPSPFPLSDTFFYNCPVP